jgi:ABC-type bacteriocin/lantibiotic exporter with double-glycine peptidase domain
MNSSVKIIPIKQPEEDACGPVALQIATSYFDKNLSFEGLTSLINYDREEGMSNEDMVRAVEKAGLKGTVTTDASWEDLQSKNTPGNIIIVSWMLHGYIGHFSVVDHVTDTHIYINNPETGLIDEMEKIIFLRLWFDYDEHWYPEKITDIQLRWMLVVNK